MRVRTRDVAAGGASTATQARAFFEDNFKPVRILPRHWHRPDGFFTGYYETEVDGSRVPTDEFNVPLYSRAGRTCGKQKQGVFAISTATRSRTARSPARVWKSAR